MNADRIAYMWLISGRVQGVGFRWFVLRRAEQLGIAGWARNLPDGRVEVLGIGTAEQLSVFDTSLRTGPRFAIVDNVEKSNCPNEVGSFKSFDIR